ALLAMECSACRNRSGPCAEVQSHSRVATHPQLEPHRLARCRRCPPSRLSASRPSGAFVRTSARGTTVCAVNAGPSTARPPPHARLATTSCEQPEPPTNTSRLKQLTGGEE